MQFFKFWAKADRSVTPNGLSYGVSCYGYSNESLEDAFRVAQQRTESAAKAIANGQEQNDEYYGGERPFKEEVVEEFISDSGEQTAIISRNHYGCLILNTPNVFFADVDKPDDNASGTSLFGFFKRATPTPSFEQELVKKIDTLCLRDASLGLRLYRTARGFRIMVTSQLILAREANSNRLLEALGSDRLYVSLCQTQDCYRARLTPKPWRCDCPSPPTRFPFSTPHHERLFRKWETEYSRVIPAFATCALIGEFGSSNRDPTVDKIIRLHDHFALDGEKPLA